jgi:extracellular elastinolytic metalloproteinase
MRRSCLLLCGGLLAVFGIAASGAAAAPPGFQGEDSERGDLDAREGRAAPTARQRAAAAGLQVTWNRFGTPQSLAAAPGGFLARGLSGDEVTAARQWVERNRDLLGIGAAAARDLELVSSAPVGAGRAVMLRQRFDGLQPARDGTIVVAVTGGNVAYVSSTLASEAALSGRQQLDAADAVRAAARDADMSLGGLSDARAQRGWTVLDAPGLTRPAQARLVALPTPTDGVRRAWETSLLDNGGNPSAFATLIDAETGDVLLRENLVDHLADNPQWSVFQNTPPMNYATTDTRVRWCWLSGPAGCALAVGNTGTPVPWDVDARTNAPTHTTEGNNAFAVHNWLSNDPFTVGVERATLSPDREYRYTWTNQWHEARCNPSVFTTAQRNDIDAARANLFAMHNRMHDWAYHLGFVEATWNLQSFNFGRGGLENDPERGNAQAGGISGGPPAFAARDNANQITFQDGMAPITNMYLWQPIAATFYAPCVDGDFDMSVIAHEYTHAISNRMAAGPNANLSGSQAGAMGESWSDLAAVEYLHSNGFAPVAGENPYAIGPYVTGDPVAGIRNHAMNQSPLNYSDVGYDFACNVATCPILSQVHADGEIWSATNNDIRNAFIARYGAGNPALQVACNRGERPVSQCAGNRRWVQLMFDAWLLMATGQVSMVDARNAMIAADQLRFNGIDADILWNAFARRGLGQAASSNGTDDADPVPSFDSPFADEATVRFRPTGDAAGAPAQLFVGRYEARVTPVADTEPGTPLGDTFRLVPGTYELIARADGFGAERVTLTVRAGQLRDLRVNMERNLASSAHGATATGDGTNLDKLIDDTEATNWASIGSPIAGKQVTVALDPSRKAHTFRRIQVSALLRTRIPADPGGDTLAQNRFTALRQYELLACEARKNVDCTQASQYESVFTSAPDAFPSRPPRPRATELVLQSFDVPVTRATHVRLRVLSNQCTGGPGFQGDLDDDPANVADCDEGSTADDTVRAAELQVFAK